MARTLSRTGVAERAPQNAMHDPGEIGRFQDRCSDLMRDRPLGVVDGWGAGTSRARSAADVAPALGFLARS